MARGGYVSEPELDMFSTLVNMGFDKSQAKAAMARCSSVEAAVGYLMNAGTHVAPASTSADAPRETPPHPAERQSGANSDKLDILMALGFEESQAEAALARCSSVEAAVEYIMSQGAVAAPERSTVE